MSKAVSDSSNAVLKVKVPSHHLVKKLFNYIQDHENCTFCIKILRIFFEFCGFSRARSSSGWVLVLKLFFWSKSMPSKLFKTVSGMFFERLVNFFEHETVPLKIAFFGNQSSESLKFVYFTKNFFLKIIDYNRL